MFGVDGLKASHPDFQPPTMGDGSMKQLNGKNFQGAHDSEVNLVNSIGLLMMLCAPHPADRLSGGGPDACLVAARRQLFFTVFAIRRREKQDGGGGGAQVSTIQEGLMAVAPS